MSAWAISGTDHYMERAGWRWPWQKPRRQPLPISKPRVMYTDDGGLYDPLRGLVFYDPLSGDCSSKRHASTSSAVDLEIPSWLRTELDSWIGRERAGFLVGSSDEADKTIWNLVEAYDEDTNRWDSVAVDLDRAVALMLDLELDRAFRGEWHDHGPGHGVHASAQDIRGAARVAELFGRDPWYLVIASAPGDDEHGQPLAVSADVGVYAVHQDGTHETLDVRVKE